MRAGDGGRVTGRLVTGRSATGQLVTAIFALAVLAGGCGSGTSSNSAADQSFVAAVHLSAPDIGSFRTNTRLIRLGHAACDAFRAGASYQEIADRMSQLEGSNPLPSQDLGVVVSSAVDAYCPQFRGKV